MTLSLFNQFGSPILFGIPLILIALVTPWLMFPSPTKQWLTNRITLLQTLFVKTSSKQIFSPLNPPAHKWAMMFTALMIFLLGLNFLGLLPYTFTPTTQLSLNLGLAIPMWLATVLIGLRKQTSLSLAHLLPEGTPTLLIPILIVIETISLFIRPMALGVRLTANLTAGHLLIQLISSAIVTLPGPAITMSAFIALLLLMILEIAVALIQAYVFMLLLSLYLQENT
uniref:ATP synthase F0 subunit 6 n=1 Tax=Phyllomedusa bahiana TaxID=860369 RepID=UPI00220404DE|nr:ATP synthase F0 subunit 6 [Phyllomedusa bahiana]UXL87083.1 ATP synthase F0 subunit 6 [Phyllomedusa bahiana]